jgi:hypothetical protein
VKTFITISIVGAMLLACSSLDFLQYRENTGLYVVEKPDSYNTMKFGTRIAASGDDNLDYMAVSAGEGTSTLFYQLADGDKLVNITSDMQDFPDVLDSASEADAPGRGSGASLTGLPIFAYNGKIEEGCMAVGEPGKSQVTVWCSKSDGFYTLKSDGDHSRFGAITAPIRLGGGTQFLLIVGAEKGFQVFSDAEGQYNRSTFTGLKSGETTAALAGGRMIDTAGGEERVFVAAGTSSDGFGVSLYQLNPQVGDANASFERKACLFSTSNSGFGGTITADDLDGDGSDELIVGATSSASPFNNTVHIFDVAAVTEAVAQANIGQDCIDIDDGDIPILATLKPEDGDLDVQCDNEDCGFGSALTVGDISLDDDGPELIVGALKATVDGVSDAGAVYIYRGWERTTKNGVDTYGDVSLAGQVADSTPESGKEFGSAAAIAPMAGRNELLISATGEGKVFIAYCTGVGDNIEDGADVSRNGDGKVVSTRCRL